MTITIVRTLSLFIIINFKSNWVNRLLIYKLLLLRDSKMIIAGPTITIIPKETNCPITCQLIMM